MVVFVVCGDCKFLDELVWRPPRGVTKISHLSISDIKVQNPKVKLLLRRFETSIIERNDSGRTDDGKMKNKLATQFQ